MVAPASDSRKSLDGNTGSLKNPCTADFTFDPFNFRAIAPIQHGVHGMLAPSHQVKSDLTFSDSL